MLLPIYLVLRKCTYGVRFVYQLAGRDHFRATMIHRIFAYCKNCPGYTVL